MSGSNATEQGVQFPLEDGRRSSTATGRKILARAAAAVDEGLARDIEAEADWRKSYVHLLRDLVQAGIPSAERATGVAEAGLRAMRDEMVFVRHDEELPLPDAFESYTEEAFDTVEVIGEGKRGTELSIPYRGDRLTGESLLDQLEAWERIGAIEPSCNEAIRDVMAHPDRLDLSDLKVVVLGAASEMGPLQTLLGWGAHVIAVDLPRPDLWERIVSVARERAGRLSIPVPRGFTGDIDEAVQVAGMDLTVNAPETRTWIDGFDGELTIGNYVYADGATFVRLESAVDVMLTDLAERRGSMPLAHLATPTDVYAVPSEVVNGAVAKRRSGLRGVAHGATRTLTARRLYVDNYRETYFDEGGRTWGISDCLVSQQGPNYALAKNMQRWRATVSRNGGSITSANLAPATRDAARWSRTGCWPPLTPAHLVSGSRSSSPRPARS